MRRCVCVLTRGGALGRQVLGGGGVVDLLRRSLRCGKVWSGWVDIGINNPVENYLEALEEHKPDILGMSALLTTTMPYMKVVIDAMVEKGIRDDYIVLVGGAPLNEAFADSIGADSYCRDAAVAVETAKERIAAKREARAAAG